MLRICTEPEFRAYTDLAYGIAIDPARAGYPSYSDGIKTKEMFIERAEKAFSRENEEILLFECEGKIEGWIHYYFLEKDRYLGTVSFNIAAHTEQALTEFLDYVQSRFEGYELFLGYSVKNRDAIRFLTSHGFECIEEDNNTTCFLSRYTPTAAEGEFVRITKENYALFRARHDAIEGDMYWNSERILADLERWAVFAQLRNGEAVGCVYYRTCADGWLEIFGIDLKDNVFAEDVFCSLLVTALNDAKERNGEYMTLFCSDEELPAVLRAGFEHADKYVCYKKAIG